MGFIVWTTRNEWPWGTEGRQHPFTDGHLRGVNLVAAIHRREMVAVVKRGLLGQTPLRPPPRSPRR